MEERTCLLCIYFKKCDSRPDKAREEFQKGTEDVFTKVAEECDDWKKNTEVTAAREEQRILKDLIENYQAGRAIAVYKNGGGPVIIIGVYKNVEEATLFTRHDEHIVIIAKKE